MKKELQKHHKVWLDAHPYRGESWLRDLLKDGFDIHHIDGNHNNNSPDNLLLLEHSDHMLIHSGIRFYKRLFPKDCTPKRKGRWLDLGNGLEIELDPGEQTRVVLKGYLSGNKYYVNRAVAKVS